MWMAVCRKCAWVSRRCVSKDAAEALGQLHEQDNARHGVVLKEVPNGESKMPKRPVGESL